MFSPTTYGPRRKFAVVVTIGGHTVKRSTLVTNGYRHPGYRIYEGTDAYVNYCINRNRPIYSANHRLYCNHPARSDRYIVLVR